MTEVKKEVANKIASNFTVHVLIQCSKRTGEIGLTMISLGSAMMRLWAMQNTPRSKRTLIFERESGKLVFAVEGAANGFNVINKNECKGTCKDYGIPLKELHAIKDDRFDK
ncbi:MAG: hypothetical protein IKS98_13120 [Lachnospiraceae bacterium]|nr:hypothetical protein [Lachnospiraceae bacterium]